MNYVRVWICAADILPGHQLIERKSLIADKYGLEPPRGAHDRFPSRPKYPAVGQLAFAEDQLPQVLLRFCVYML